MLGTIACKQKDEYKDLDCSSLNSSYRQTIQPLIALHCAGSDCHGAGSSNGNYTTYEGLIIRINNGTFSKRVLYTKDMPANGSLSLAEREKIKCWLNRGAPKD
ncbi:hypothetical protein CNR22_01100 [Sphingobacteriaceae bacterium]|nr:hypothetical protein CNR22_01100 [Sphingobacteriaceae bacterium]